MGVSKHLRIAMISEHASPLASLGGVDAGGQNVYVLEVARRLASAGHQVDVLTRRDHAMQPAMVELRRGLRVIHIPAGPPEPIAKEALLPHMPAFSAAVERLARHNGGYDVVHANFFLSGLAALRLKQTLGTPFVITFHALGLVRREHQGADDGFPRERTEIERTLVRQADRLIAECPQDESDLIRLYGARPETITVVPCGVDMSQFRPMGRTAARRRLGLAGDDFTVLQLGRLVPRKGIDTVVRAMACLDPAVRARLLIVGGNTPTPDPQATPEIARLRALARQLGVDQRVSFLGQRARRDLRCCYAAADVFVTTPWYEPFGITPLEAMACGVPVVGSEVGGIRYSVLHGVTGLLVPPRDPRSLARCLGELHSHPEVAQAMGRAGRARVASLFTWERVAHALDEVYRDVLDARATKVAADIWPVLQDVVQPLHGALSAPLKGLHGHA